MPRVVDEAGLQEEHMPICRAEPWVDWGRQIMIQGGSSSTAEASCLAKSGRLKLAWLDGQLTRSCRSARKDRHPRLNLTRGLFDQTSDWVSSFQKSSDERRYAEKRNDDSRRADSGRKKDNARPTSDTIVDK